MYALEGKAAVVTGGASGIGRAIALRLAQEGCDVGVIDKNADGAAETEQQIRARDFGVTRFHLSPCGER